MNKEEKENALAAAIQARDLAKVQDLVENHGCRTGGPEPWIQTPLYFAALSGRVDIVKYLLQKYAQPVESTLRGAIESNVVGMVRFISEECGVEWSVSDFEAAFAASFEVCQYAFEVAYREEWLDPNFNRSDDESGYLKMRIFDAVRRTLIRRNPHDISALIGYLNEVSSIAVLYTVHDDCSPLVWLKEFIEERNVAGFEVTWKAVHDAYFERRTHAELDMYVWGTSVQEFFYYAIKHHCNELFYKMCSYTLPHLGKCAEIAQDCENLEITEYLATRT